MSELRECPFCGGEVCAAQYRGRFYVACNDSECPVTPKTDDFPTEAKAAVAWNRRSDDRYELTDAGRAKVGGA